MSKMSEAGKKGFEKTQKAVEAHRKQQHDEAFERYMSNPNYCLNCGELVPYEKRANKFCNQSCAASFNNRGVLRVKKSEPKNCANCGALVTKRNKYCDSCIAEGVYINKYDDVSQTRWDPTRKRILLAKREYRCESCGLSEWLGQKIPLELDHIDGNADNNDESNLRLICPNCHALTETYKGANVGKDSSRQKMRRQRYKEGKTY